MKMEIEKAAKNAFKEACIKSNSNNYLRIESDFVHAVCFLDNCYCGRVYASVIDRSNLDPLAIIKIKLFSKNSKKTILLNLNSVHFQILEKHFSYHHNDSKVLARFYDPIVQKLIPEQLEKLNAEILVSFKNFKNDSLSQDEILGKFKIIKNNIYKKNQKILLDHFSKLLKNGNWSKEDVIKVWEKAMCISVHNS